MAEMSQIQTQRERLLADFKKEGPAMRSYVNVQGITVYGIYLSKFTSKNEWKDKGERKVFECEKVSIMPCSFHQSSLPEEQRGNETAILTVFPPGHKRGEPIPPYPVDAAWPETYDFHLKRSCWFVAEDAQRADLAMLQPGDMVKVSGVHARGRNHSAKEKDRTAAEGREPRPTAAQLKFGVINRVRDIEGGDMYAALREDKAVRTSRFSPPGSIADGEDSTKILVVKWDDEPLSPGESLLVPERTDSNVSNWKYKQAKDNPSGKENAMAKPSFAITQEVGVPPTSQNFFVDLTIWNEALSIFGIPDVQKWIALAPRVFDELPYIVFGSVNGTRSMNMSINVTGNSPLGEDGKPIFEFGICMTGKCVLADVAAHYTDRIGIPVSKAYVERRFKVAPSGSRESQFAPPKFACLDCREDKDELVHHPSVRFFAIAASYYQGMSKLSEGEGDALMRVLDTGRSNELPKEHPMFSVVTGTRIDGAVTSVVFAIRDDRKTTEAEKKRRADAVRLFFTGKPAEVSDSAPAPVDDDDDDDGLDEISEHEHENKNKSEPNPEPEPKSKEVRKELDFQDDPMERDPRTEQSRDQHKKRAHREDGGKPERRESHHKKRKH